VTIPPVLRATSLYTREAFCAANPEQLRRHDLGSVGKENMVHFVEDDGGSDF